MKRDRVIILCGLFFITGLSWLYIIYLYRQMVYMDMSALFFAMPMTPKWTSIDFILLFLMWIVMMIAMMTPSVAPLVLIFAKINRERKQSKPFINAGYLLTGYFVVWAAFSFAATCLQWLLQQLSLLNPDMKTTSKILGCIMLSVTGIFQFTPLKQTCLKYCRSPLGFVLHSWKEGKTGAFKMGMENGLFCVGCCWLLMVLLFVAGIMNLLWVAIIAVFVLVEKITPGAKWIAYVAGVALISYGGVLLLMH